MSVQKDFCIVGIGASAGGLEAIEAFFSKVPTDSGMAYIIVQHLSPDYKSLMPEILSKRTELEVHTAEDGMKVRPNKIYLIPRKMNMKIFHRKLHLTEKDTGHLLNLPVDIFFNSLAEDCGEKAIGVVLSGTGSDGSRGIRVIKEHGGMIIAQDPETSRFDGMPRSAISTGVVDFILPPELMPEKIINFVKHPYVIDKIKAREFDLSEDHLTKIILLLKDEFNLDFTFYKNSTIIRRIERRMSINQIETLMDYLSLLYTSDKERKTLYKELLIGVTKFFRDTEAFDYLEKEIIPKIFSAKHDNDEVRVWVAGCSTGEEAYSVAILFKEYLKKHKLFYDVKIFATDVDKASVEFASQGVYNGSIIADVNMDRLEAYFYQNGDTYKIKEEIREMIVFASHNLIKDPPFNKIDLITCRNLLIYFQNVLQQKILSLFNFALNPDGFLFLGSSETLGEMSTYYETLNIKWKIFCSKRENVFNLKNTLTSKTVPFLQNYAPHKRSMEAIKNTIKSNQNTLLTEKLLNDHVPPTVVVNENYQIVNTHGNINEFLFFKEQKSIIESFELNITQMVPSNLKLTFNISINKAFKTNDKVIHNNLKYKNPFGKVFLLDLVFSPFKSDDGTINLAVIYFIKKETEKKATTESNNLEDLDKQAQQRIFDLEQELKHTKENLQASIEELETTNEELQSTNEELISANEELQSTNEELQSVNEELYTVNTEFQAKNHDLTVMNQDMENLMQNSDIRLIFLDNNYKIRKFTLNITEIFHLRQGDEGRPLTEITHRIDNFDLEKHVKTVSKNGVEVEDIIQVKEKWFQIKIVPYRTSKGTISGVVISFMDITKLYLVQMDLSNSEQKFKSAFLYSPIGFAIISTKGKFSMVNKVLCKMIGYKEEELLQLSLQNISYPEDWSACLELLEKMLNGELKTFSLEKRCIHKDKHIIWISLDVSQVYNTENQTLYFIAQIQDISKSKVAIQTIQENLELARLTQKLAKMGNWRLEIKTNSLYWSEHIANLFGLTDGEFDGTYSFFMQCIHPEDRDLVVNSIQKALHQKQDYNIKHRILWKDGSIHWMHEVGIVHYGLDGEPTEMVGVVRDITEEVR